VFFDRLAVRSAGTERDADNPVSRDDVNWADTIFVMEARHRKRLQNMFGSALAQKRIVVLGILDDYEFMQPELIELLEERMRVYLEGFVNTNLELEAVSRAS
jgi:predicted protein tyrosine phosphatase